MFIIGAMGRGGTQWPSRTDDLRAIYRTADIRRVRGPFHVGASNVQESQKSLRLVCCGEAKPFSVFAAVRFGEIAAGQ